MMISTHESNGREEHLVERLLGRIPKIPYQVATRCGDGTPQVLRAAPLLFEDGRWKPFPTCLWLTCPRLRLEVARLEATGMIQEMKERLGIDPAFRMAFLEGQRMFSEWRWREACSMTDDSLPAEVERVMRETTIAGSRQPEGVKCLHAHLAQHLAFGHNPIGELVSARVGPCDVERACGTWLADGAQNERKTER